MAAAAAKPQVLRGYLVTDSNEGRVQPTGSCGLSVYVVVWSQEGASINNRIHVTLFPVIYWSGGYHLSTILTVCVLVLPLELYSFWINTWLGKVGLVIYTREQGFWLGHCMHIHESAWNLISYTKLGWGVIWLWQATPSSTPKTYPVGWGDGWKTPTYQSDTHNWHDFQL